ncbi:zinc metalloproteinase nas-39-like [Diadema antillarum]|uniref:zinc metalloproteinase nas-39-like n=1 Tax=Diadema antillarum TaxID=105358 RepID=UPI003A87CCCB
MCVSNEVFYAGYCLGVIKNDTQGACDKIFRPGSYAVAVKTRKVQEFLDSHQNTLAASASNLVIGLTVTANNLRWPDNTPALYTNFASENVSEENVNNTTEQCAYINVFSCSKWELYNCLPAGRSTICQADINECATDTPKCEHTCVNHDGGYHCACSEGYRIESEFACKDVCASARQEGHEWTIEGGRKCVSEYRSADKLEDALENCLASEARLPTIHEIAGLQESLRLPMGNPCVACAAEMVEATSTPDGSSSDSVVLCSQNGSSSAHWQHCDGPLNYVCIKDMSYILIEELQKQGEHSVKVTEKFGYIALHQYPPWFETNSHFHVSFLMKEDLSIWLSVLWINLLSDEEGGCIDHLQIYDPDPSSDIYVDICGSPPGFNLFLSRHVSMNVSIGVLRADRAQDTTGFSMVFEAVDCSQIECTPGCGSTSLEYTPSEKVLRTMNFPSKLQAFSDCNTTIDAPQDTFIAIKFLGYQIRDPTSGKCEDRIIFTSPVWSHPIEFLCRDDIPPVFFTNASRISVELVTGFEMVSSGFTADVEFFKKPACVVKPMETCDSSPYDCEGTSGVITLTELPVAHPQPRFLPLECSYTKGFFHPFLGHQQHFL